VRPVRPVETDALGALVLMVAVDTAARHEVVRERDPVDLRGLVEIAVRASCEVVQRALMSWMLQVVLVPLARSLLMGSV
jgi:hypothetical protein